MKAKETKLTEVLPFLSINEAVKVTGISAFSLRRGCKEGTIPHIKVGDKYLINYPLLLERDDSPPNGKTVKLRRTTHNKSLLFSRSSTCIIPCGHRIVL